MFCFFFFCISLYFLNIFFFLEFLGTGRGKISLREFFLSFLEIFPHLENFPFFSFRAFFLLFFGKFYSTSSLSFIFSVRFLFLLIFHFGILSHSPFIYFEYISEKKTIFLIYFFFFFFFKRKIWENFLRIFPFRFSFDCSRRNSLKQTSFKFLRKLSKKVIKKKKKDQKTDAKCL